MTVTHLQVLADLARWPDVLLRGAALLAQAQEPDAFALVLHAHYMQDSLGTSAAQMVLQQARALWPGDERWAFFAAHQALALGLLAQAEREARAGLALNPQAAYLHNGLAQVLAAGQNWAGAAQALDQALRLAPQEALYHTERARMAHNQQDKKTAFQHVRQALQLDPNNAHALALLAVLQGPVQVGQSRRLLGQALRAMPLQTAWQAQWRDLGWRWWLDVALAVLGCLLTLSCQPWGWVPVGLAQGLPTQWPLLVLAFNSVLAYSWLGRVQRTGLLWFFAYAQALCWGAGAATSLPMRWVQQGPQALWDWQTSAYLAGSIVVALLGIVVLGLMRLTVSEPLRLAWVFGREGVQAKRRQRGLPWLVDVALRPATHFNAGVALLALAISGPWVVPAMLIFWWIFAMPVAVMLLALWRLPKGLRPNFYLVFWLLGVVPGLGTFLWTSNLRIDVAHGAGGLQMLWALALAAYATLQANSLRQV